MMWATIPGTNSFQPNARGASDDLTDLAGHDCTSGDTRHTRGARSPVMWFNLWELEEGSLIVVHWLDKRL